MFDLEQFAADCRAALAADSSHRLVREVVTRAVSDPGAILKGIGEPKRSEVQKLYHAPDLTILNVIWGPMMTIMPHNHQMWAVIGIYTGREDNVFWRRLPDGNGKVEAAGRERYASATPNLSAKTSFIRLPIRSPGSPAPSTSTAEIFSLPSEASGTRKACKKVATI